jgi:hypothetical protein
MRFIRYAAFIICLLSLVSGCRQAPPATSAAVSISLALSQASTVGETTARITLTGASGEPIDGARVTLRGDMTHAGMQPVIRETDVSKQGVYTLPFEWTMGGDWFIEVSVVLPDGGFAAQTFEGYRISSQG